MKNDIFNLFQDENVWIALVEFSGDSSTGNVFLKSNFSIKDLHVLSKKNESKSFFDLIEKYEKISFKESLIKFKDSVKNIVEKSTITNEKKLELFNQDLPIVQKRTLKWYQSKTKTPLTLELIQSDPELNEKFNDHCLSFWLNKINPLIEECQKGSYYNFEDKLYTNRHLSL